jgi:hypothetical protein
MLKNFEYLKSDQKANEFLAFLALHQQPEFERMDGFIVQKAEEPPEPLKSDLKLNLIKADLVKSDLAGEMANLNGNFNLFVKEIARIDQVHLLNPLKNSYYTLLEDFKSKTEKFNDLMQQAIGIARSDLEERFDFSSNDLEQIEVLNTKIVENQVKSLQALAWQQKFTKCDKETANLSEEDIIDIENDIQRLIYQSENEFDTIQAIKRDLALKDFHSTNYTLYKSVLEKVDLLIENVMLKLDSQKNMIDVIDQDHTQITAGLVFSKQSMDIIDNVKTWFSTQKV